MIAGLSKPSWPRGPQDLLPELAAPASPADLLIGRFSGLTPGSETLAEMCFHVMSRFTQAEETRLTVSPDQ